MTTFHTDVNLDYLYWCQQIDSELSILATGEQDLCIIFNTTVPQLIYTPVVNQNHRNWHKGELSAPYNPVSQK